MTLLFRANAASKMCLMIRCSGKVSVTAVIYWILLMNQVFISNHTRSILQNIYLYKNNSNNIDLGIRPWKIFSQGYTFLITVMIFPAQCFWSRQWTFHLTQYWFSTVEFDLGSISMAFFTYSSPEIVLIITHPLLNFQ